MNEDRIALLRRMPLFSELPDTDLETLCVGSDDVFLKAGQQLFAEGEVGDRAYVIVRGDMEVVKQSGPREVLLAVRGPGEVIGEMALIEDSPRTAGVRSRGQADLISIRKEQMDQLLSTSLPATRTLFYTILERWRGTEAMLRQSERMAQLGTLTAGVAHELNNPAAAVRRGAEQIRQAILDLAEARASLAENGFADDEMDAVKEEIDRAKAVAARPPNLDALERSDREAEIEEALDDAGVEDPWDLTSALVSLDFDAQKAQELLEEVGPDKFNATTRVLASAFDVYNLLAEVRQGATRISDIVKALKSYSNPDEAPLQEIDINDSLDDTLMILRNKLKQGILVKKEYGELPRIQAHGGELNQVWTNIIDNAADALNGDGTVTIRTRAEGDNVVVEIEDDGPGIPKAIQERVFDAFFTTKPPGKGTGLGLDISYNIVTFRHKGAIALESAPGRTLFRIRLPVSQ